jgi:non-homologous end joining protein Ku
MRKVIEFDDSTYQALVQLGRDRMATLQELADESFADLLKKHGVPKDLRDALRRSAKVAAPTAKRKKKIARKK